MLTRPRLLFAIAYPQDIFGSCGGIEFELLSRPDGNNCDGCSRGEPTALRASIEMNLHGYPPAFMDMHMAVPVKLQRFDRQRKIDGGLPVLAILDFVWLV
jgi:hypothetical protein